MPRLYFTSFDDGFEEQERDTHLLCPVGWRVIWVPGEKPGPVRPEVQPEIRKRGDKGMRSGEHGVKLAHAYSFFQAALVRRFAASPGKHYQASVWATAETSPKAGLGCTVGIHPDADALTGVLDNGIRWSEWYGTDDPNFKAYRWQECVVDAMAEGNEIAVLLRCDCRTAVQVNAGFFDDFGLYVEGEDVPAPPPEGSGVVAQLRTQTEVLRLEMERSRTLADLLESADHMADELAGIL